MLVLFTEYKSFLSKYNACVHNVLFFSDTSTWCHKVHSKYVGKMFAFAIIYHFAKDIEFFIIITIYHLCISQLS